VLISTDSFLLKFYLVPQLAVHFTSAHDYDYIIFGATAFLRDL